MSQSTCKAKTAVKQISFPKDGFSMNGTPLFQCKPKKKGGSYAYVCNGADGIQQLSYSTANCKGKATQMMAAKFKDAKLVCQYSPESKKYSTATCVGPSSMNWKSVVLSDFFVLGLLLLASGVI